MLIIQWTEYYASSDWSFPVIYYTIRYTIKTVFFALNSIVRKDFEKTKQKQLITESTCSVQSI